MSIKIYALLDPETKNIRYIGKTNNINRRLKEHVRIKDGLSTRLARWIVMLRRVNLVPILKVLEHVQDDTWQQAEEKWIIHFRSKNYDLLNLTTGGDGLHNPTAETIQKISTARRIIMSDPAMKEKIFTNERSANISKALKGKSHSAEHVAKLPQNQLGRKQGEEQKRKISASLIGNQRRKDIPQTEATKLKIANTNRGKTHSPETKEKMRQSAILRHQHKKELGNA